jgi:hypothetical protein
MYVNHILVIHYMTLQHYIWFVFYDLLLMTMKRKMSRQTLNDYLSFATRLLQLRAFSHILFGMITKLVIYGIIYLKFSSSAHMFQ